MALQEHASLRAFFNGTFLKEVTSITFRTESGQIRVEGLEGLLGFSPGSGVCTVTIELGIPISGQEQPVQQNCVKGALVDMQIPIGQEGSYAGRGKIMDVDISQSTSAAASESFTWEGEFREIK